MCIPCQRELQNLYQENFRRLCQHLERKYRVLDSGACEDAAAEAHQEAWEKCCAGFQPEQDWWRYWQWLADKRALDRVRKTEREKTVSIATLLGDSSGAGWEPADPDGPPDQIAMAREELSRRVHHERRRQECRTRMLSELLKEFTSECERDGRLAQKQAYERAMRGQKPDRIAVAMKINRNHVYQHIHRSREWLFERVRQKDVHESVFTTFHAIEAEARKVGRKPRMSEVTCLGDLVHWVMANTDAMCPSEDRLREFIPHRQDPQFADIRFHVEEACCHRCRVELEVL